MRLGLYHRNTGKTLATRKILHLFHGYSKPTQTNVHTTFLTTCHNSDVTPQNSILTNTYLAFLPFLAATVGAAVQTVTGVPSNPKTP